MVFAWSDDDDEEDDKGKDNIDEDDDDFFDICTADGEIVFLNESDDTGFAWSGDSVIVSAIVDDVVKDDVDNDELVDAINVTEGRDMGDDESDRDKDVLEVTKCKCGFVCVSVFDGCMVV